LIMLCISGNRATHLVYRATGQNPSAQWIQITNQRVLRSSRKQHKGVTCTNMLAFSQMRIQDAGTNLGRCDDRYRCRSLQWCVCECKIPQKYALLNWHTGTHAPFVVDCIVRVPACLLLLLLLLLLVLARICLQFVRASIHGKKMN